jgi:hypothetical protein
MNVLEKCKNDLVRIGQSLSQALQSSEKSCECDIELTAVEASDLTCGCGQDMCQIGNGPNACKPQHRGNVEQVEGA